MRNKRLCGVNGYTAMIALALVFLIIATSVLNKKDLSNCPNTLIPEHSSIIEGTTTMFLRKRLVKLGTYIDYSFEGKGKQKKTN